MNLLPIRCEAYYLADFLSGAEADALFSEILSGFDVTDRRVRMCDGTEHISETGAYMFADPELTSFDALPEVWAKDRPGPTRLPWCATESPSKLAFVSGWLDASITRTAPRARISTAIFLHTGQHPQSRR
jgi:hypothetical protein